MRIFYRDWVKNAMEKLGMTEDTPIESGMVTRAIARAQKKVEDRNFEIRRNLLEYDEVMNEQRKEIYGTRQDVLEKIELREKVEFMFARAIDRHARKVHFQDAEGFRTWFLRSFGFEVPAEMAADATAKVGNPKPVIDLVLQHYAEREKALGGDIMRQVERYLLLKALDDKWRDHLLAIDSLKAGIGLRGYAQVDPKTEYKREGFQLFEQLLHAIEDEVTGLILRIQVDPSASRGLNAPPPRYVSPVGANKLPTNPALSEGVTPPVATPGSNVSDGSSNAPPVNAQPGAVARPAPPPARPGRSAAAAASGPGRLRARVAAVRPGAAPAGVAAARAQQEQKPAAQPAAGDGAAASASGASKRVLTPKDLEGVGRNDVCPCGSGQKFKKCHGRDL
jgi:preprotein translocase subunit SecA